jgi:hypothetical protein
MAALGFSRAKKEVIYSQYFELDLRVQIRVF